MTDFKNLCMNCMSDLGGQDVCPVCGHRKGEPQRLGALPFGTVLQNRYAVGSVKHSNGEGSLYIGLDTVLNTPVELHEFFPASLCKRGSDGKTVQVLKGSETAYRECREKFLSYFRGIAHMRELSPIVQIYDIFEENNAAYTISEWQESITLRYFVERSGGSLGWNLARQLFMPVLSALCTLHAHFIGHFGISPDTLLIMKDGKMKLGGFSIPAIRQMDTVLPPSLVPGCAALEQYVAGYELSEPTDIYGFAASLFFALTGQLPPEALKRRTDARLFIPNAVMRSLPPYVISSLANALQVSPEKRTSTFEQLRTELSAAPAVTAAIEASQKFHKLSEPSVQDSSRRKHKKEVPGFVWVLSSCLITIVVLTAVGAVWINRNAWYQTHNITAQAAASQASSLLSGSSLSDSSLSAGQMTVPNLVGKNYADLTAKSSSQPAENQNYQILLSSQQFSDTVPEGQIISQDPKPGGKMAKGTAIVVVVSQGAAVRTLPKIAGKTLSGASNTVAAAGFVPSESEEYSGTVAEGKVIGYQDVKEGDQMAYGSKVIIVVSKGVSPFTAPAADSESGSSG